MALIETISIALTATTDKLTAGLAKGRSALSSFAGMATSTGPLIGAALAGLGAGFSISKIKEAADEIDNIGKAADRLGVGTEFFQGIAHGANLSGVETEALSKSLEFFNRQIGSAGGGLSEAKPAFDALGLSMDDLNKMSAEDRIKVAADRIAQLPDAASQAAAAFQLFGKEGAKMTALFAGGSAGLDEFKKEAETLGLSFSRLDASKVEAMNDNFTRLGEKLHGYVLQAAIQIAPYVTALTDAFLEWANQGMSASDVISTGLEWVGSGIGLVADICQVLKLAFLATQAAITTGLAYMADGWAYQAKAIEYIVNKLPGVKIAFGEVLEEIGKDLHKLADDQWAGFNKELAKPPASDGVKKFFADIRTAADKAAAALQKPKDSTKGWESAIKATEEALKEVAKQTFDIQALQNGWSERQKKIAEFEGKGVSDKVLEQLEAQDEMLTKLEKEKKKREELEQFAKSTTEQFQPLSQKIGEDFIRLKKAFSKDLIDESTFKSAAAGLQGQLLDQVGASQNRAGAVDFRSSEARSFNLANQQNSPFSKLIDRSTEQLQEFREARKLLQKLTEETKTTIATFN